MKKTIKTNILFLVLAVLTTAILYSCKDDAVTTTGTGGPEANSISGTVTFVETDSSVFGSNTVGTYEVVAFSSWPPMGPPSGSDTLVYTKVGNVYKGTYKITGLSDGDYVIANGWRTTIGWQSPGLGIYGSDTASNIVPTTVTITNNAGVENINFLSWADTTKAIF